MNLLATTFALAIGINVMMFLPAYFLKTDKLTDISYALTFVAISFFSLSLGEVTSPSLLLFLMILLWATRLGGYLLFRIQKIGKDKRFDQRREKFWSFANFWLLQGATAWIVLLPSIMFFGNKIQQLSAYSYIAMVIWLLGLLIETVADAQKFNFIGNPANQGKWISTGLWKYSRHPNYFGEILAWVGIYLFTVFGLTPIQSLAGVISPIFIATLIIFVSGIPLLEKSADKRWGDNKEYQKYKKAVGVLVPFI